MKNLIVFAVISLLTSLSAHAAVEKICFGSYEAKGNRFVLSATTKKATISRVSGNEVGDLNGSYPRTGITKSKDGKVVSLTYLLSDVEGGTYLIVDRELLKPETKGAVKMRWRGEGFEQTTYFCKDNN
jgi:hypothetical protein